MIVKFNLKQKTYAFFTLLALAELLNFAMVLSLETSSEENHEWVAHTFEVIQESEKLLGYLRDAETGQRGYLLTGKKEYLAPYFSGVELSRKTLMNLVGLTSDNPQQQQSLLKIDQLIDKKFKELELTIMLHKKNQEGDALAVVLSDEGKMVMDTIRKELAQFLAVEENLLEERHDRYHQVHQTIIRTFLIECILFGLLIIVLVILVKKNIIKPLETLTNRARNFRLHTKYRPVYIKNKDEIGELAMAFNAMGDAINQTAKSLKQDRDEALLERDDAIYKAITDPLTGLNNRNYFYLQINQRLQASIRYHQPLGLLMMDIDHFKNINDKYGHSVGDEVLRQIGKAIKTEIRASDMAIRYGGEEFVVILTNTSQDKASVKAESLRELIQYLNIPELNGQNVTISIGVSQLRKNDANIDEIINRADKALYKAKENGRNQVCMFDDI